jgi:hypothetical protein
MTGKKIIYSLKWAQEVVQKLRKSHARATEFLLQETGISEGKLVLWLATGSKEYYVVREMLKFIDKALKYGHQGVEAAYLAENTTRLLSLFKARLEQFNCESAYSTLTGIQLCLNLEEPVIKGVSEGVVPPDDIPSMAPSEQELLGGGLNIHVDY